MSRSALGLTIVPATRLSGVGALAHGLTAGLTRPLEDPGVCFSSCLDGWDDDLVLQAFDRCAILAPQSYANPWFPAPRPRPSSTANRVTGCWLAGRSA